MNEPAVDTIEYYDIIAVSGRDLIATVKSSMVPPPEAKISINSKVWEVVSVTYALDYSDAVTFARMRANVDLRKCS